MQIKIKHAEKMKNHKKFSILCIAVLLQGCATQEFRNALDSCRIDATQKYPQVFANVKVMQEMPIYDKKGKFLYSIPYEDNQRVDINEESRDSDARRCAQQKCLNEFGNAGCNKR